MMEIPDSPSLLFKGHFSKRQLLSVYKETLRRQTPKERVSIYSSLERGPVLCAVDVFSNKPCSITQLEDTSPITWERDE